MKKDWFILLGLVLVFICFGVIIHSDMAPDISATTLMRQTWLGLLSGYTGAAVIVFNLIKKPNYFRRAQNFNW